MINAWSMQGKFIYVAHFIHKGAIQSALHKKELNSHKKYRNENIRLYNDAYKIYNTEGNEEHIYIFLTLLFA